MHLDLATLMIGDSIIAAAGAVLLFVVWLEDRAWPALFWSAGNLCLALGIALLACFPPPPSDGVRVACAALFCSADSMILAGAMSFAARPVFPWFMLLGIAGSLALSELANWGVMPIVGTAVAEAIPGLFIAWAAFVLWSGRSEKLKARIPLVGFMAIHALVIEAIVPASLQASISMEQPSVTSLFGLIHFETIVYVMATAVLLTSLLRERKEAFERARAIKDPLIPGLLNRRGFVAEAERVLAAFPAGSPVALLMFDLDHFKRINDTFGHQLGDEVLVTFGKVVRKALRPTDVLGRLGGEEFVALLKSTSFETAVALAERARSAYAEAAQFVGGQPVRNTVTIGVKVTDRPIQLGDLLDAADAALYEAKALGRDRVQLHRDKPAPTSNIIRISYP